MVHLFRRSGRVWQIQLLEVRPEPHVLIFNLFVLLTPSFCVRVPPSDDSTSFSGQFHLLHLPLEFPFFGAEVWGPCRGWWYHFGYTITDRNAISQVSVRAVWNVLRLPRFWICLVLATVPDFLGLLRPRFYFYASPCSAAPRRCNTVVMAKPSERKANTRKVTPSHHRRESNNPLRCNNANPSEDKETEARKQRVEQIGTEKWFLYKVLCTRSWFLYKGGNDAPAVMTAKLSKMNVNRAQYIFKVRSGQLSVRANTSYKSYMSIQENMTGFREDFIKAYQKLAPEEGAMNWFILARTARELEAFVHTTEFGHVILGIGTHFP